MMFDLRTLIPSEEEGESAKSNNALAANLQQGPREAPETMMPVPSPAGDWDECLKKSLNI